MARIFPSTPLVSVRPEAARVFRALKKLPDDWLVWYHLIPSVPDFLLLDSGGRALLLAVGRATPQQAHQAPQLQLVGLEMEKTVPGRDEEQCLHRFLAQVVGEGVPPEAVGGVVLFPNLERRDIQAVEQAADHRYPWLERDWLEEQEGERWATLFPSQSLDSPGQRVLRARFAPEVVVPPRFVARVPHRPVAAGLGDYLLDYDQESVLKTDLDLEGEQLAQDFQVQVVNGVTGSGKTLILLYRLRLLHDLFPNKRFLVLTHNRPLIREMRARFCTLQPHDSGRIHWHTFMGWCRANWPAHEPYNPLPLRQRDALVREVQAEYLVGSSVSGGMFRSEVDWVKDSGIVTREEYLAADRRGRGFRLTQGQREHMFGAMQAYQRRLIAGEIMDWGDVPRRMWRWIEQGDLEPPQYDVVMVDEAQFFAPLWFDIVRRLVVPGSGHLFVAADPTQGFLRRGESWRSIAGLEVRGRSHHLQHSYRTTRSILDLAVTFYQRRLPGDIKDPLFPDLVGVEEGKAPRLLRFDSPQDERARIVNEIVRAAAGGLPLRHILILHASWRGVELLIETLNRSLGRGRAIDPKDRLSRDALRVTTINAATGLESPVVFVAGLHEMFEQEGSLRLNAEERSELVQENTRRLYMAFTRAGQRLVLTYAGELPALLWELAEQGKLVVEAAPLPVRPAG
ncbi:MAG: DEAD/DEAH box helicase family protein [Anaerolineae bacterium]|nr:DEAD/DEAH box helicase family protein [Anaerolineae bacterium]